MNVYDFDGTILKGDSEFYFFDYLIKKSLIKNFSKLIFIRNVKKRNKRNYKFLIAQNKIYKTIFKKVNNLENVLEKFWDEHEQFIKDFYLKNKKDDDVIVSATPEFILLPILKRLGISHLVASKWDNEKKCFSYGINEGINKVINFKKFYKTEEIDEFYGDSLLDFEMAKLAKQAYKVIDEDIIEWNTNGYKISTETQSLANHVGFEKAIVMYAKAGFDCYDFSMFNMINFNWDTRESSLGESPLVKPTWKKYVKNIRNIADKYLIKCNQSHAPFPSEIPVTRKLLKKCILITSMLGADKIVIHPANNYNTKENVLFFNKILKYAKKHGITICAENMYNWDKKLDKATIASCYNSQSFTELVNEMNSENFAACVDVGHANIFGDLVSAPELIRSLGKKVVALHLHDNDLWRDLHQLPFTNKIDYNDICKSLVDIGYKGEITLEADSYLNDKKDCLFSSVKEMARVARKIALMIENQIK